MISAVWELLQIITEYEDMGGADAQHKAITTTYKSEK